MAPNQFQFTTGPAQLPDVGELTYNGCTFNPLFATTISGNVVKDEAGRTTKYMEYTLTADGYVTLPGGNSDINPTMLVLRNLLTAQGGVLTYKGRGFDLVINKGGAGGGGKHIGAAISSIIPAEGYDVAWGPVPKLIEFQPLGSGRSAKVQWQVTVRIPEVKGAGKRILQLNYESSVSYAEDGYSTLSVSGTLEIPMTRIDQKTRTLTSTVDDYRAVLEERILKGIDLDLFRITRRDFQISRDKRTLEWAVEAEERPYMDLPPDCAIARGTYNVRPTKVGIGLSTWLCTLKATYMVRVGMWRRIAWLSFLALMRLRMDAAGIEGSVPETSKPQASPPPTPFVQPTGILPIDAVVNIFRQIPVAVDIVKIVAGNKKLENRAPVWLLDFTIEEGVYLDSKTITFSATWRLLSKFSYILLTSGIWRKLPEKDINGRNLWATSMRNVQGSQSWLPNKLDPALDVIVDFGGPDSFQ